MTRQRPVLDQINIVVDHMNAAVDFYTRLGVEVGPAPDEWAGHHRSCDAGAQIGVDLDSSTFAGTWNEGLSADAGVMIGFRVGERSDVDDLHSELTEAGYRSQQSPYDTFWGARYAIVEDPSGNAVGLMSQPDPAKRTMPPAVPAS
jgi:predicted lactoylglutathione lyase